jgi:hypothetical protein
MVRVAMDGVQGETNGLRIWEEKLDQIETGRARLLRRGSPSTVLVLCGYAKVPCLTSILSGLFNLDLTVGYESTTTCATDVRCNASGGVVKMDKIGSFRKL